MSTPKVKQRPHPHDMLKRQGQEDTSFVVNKVDGSTGSVEYVGDIKSNRLKELVLENLNIKKIGMLELPIIETLEFAGNRLTKLNVEGGQFASSLSEYSFAGSQIAGPLPIAEAQRFDDKQLYNFFDKTQALVGEQSRLYVEVDGERYEGKRPSLDEQDGLYTIDLESNEDLKVSDLIQLVKMYDRGYDPEDSTRLFEHHTWKYAFVNMNAQRMGANKSQLVENDSSVVEGLTAGDNYLELSLEGADETAGKNENAKVYFKVVKAKDTTIPTPPPGENGGSNVIGESGETTLPGTTNTGDSTSLNLWILLGIVSVGTVAYFAKKKLNPKK